MFLTTLSITQAMYDKVYMACDFLNGLLEKRERRN